MTRAIGPDGRPWWLSNGPPSHSDLPPAPASPSQAPPPKPDSPQVDLGPAGAGEAELPATVINAGLGILSAVAGVLARPAAQPSPTATLDHDPTTCGVCPLCLALAALQERDPEVAEVLEGAMRGVTASAERVAALVPRAVDALGEVLAGQLLRTLIARFMP